MWHRIPYKINISRKLIDGERNKTIHSAIEQMWIADRFDVYDCVDAIVCDDILLYFFLFYFLFRYFVTVDFPYADLRIESETMGRESEKMNMVHSLS